MTADLTVNLTVDADGNFRVNEGAGGVVAQNMETMIGGTGAHDKLA